MPKPAALPTHLYQPDGLTDRRGGPQGCRQCTMPAKHPVHALPPVDADVRHAEARRLGEAES